MATDHKQACLECIEACTTCVTVCTSCCGTEPDHKLEMVKSCKNAAEACQKFVDISKVRSKDFMSKECQMAFVKAIEKCLACIELAKKTAETCSTLGYDCETSCKQTAEACQECIDACNKCLQEGCF